MPMPQTPENFTRPLPDLDTQEITLYGTCYSQVKLQEYRIDRTIYELRCENDGIMSAVDVDLAATILEARPDIARSTFDLDDWVQSLDDRDLAGGIVSVATMLRIYETNRLAIEWLETRKVRIRLAARLIGASEHSAAITHTDENVWRASALANSNKVPISYAAIRSDA